MSISKKVFNLYIGERRKTEENAGPLFNNKEYLVRQDREKADLPHVRSLPQYLMPQRPWQRLDQQKFIFSEKGEVRECLKRTGHAQVHGP